LDTASVPANLTESHPINRQGSNRYQRASNFFRTSQVLAMEKGFEFNWQFKEVPHVGHSTSKMLYGNPELRSWTIEGTQRVYDNNDLTTMGAFNLLKPFLVVEEARIWYNPADEQSSVVHQQLWSRDDVGALYDRLPVYAEQIVRPEVWSRARDAAGLKLVFNTDAHDITIRYVVTRKKYAMSHFPATGVSGIDLFVENRSE